MQRALLLSPESLMAERVRASRWCECWSYRALLSPSRTRTPPTLHCDTPRVIVFECRSIYLNNPSPCSIQPLVPQNQQNQQREIDKNSGCSGCGCGCFPFVLLLPFSLAHQHQALLHSQQQLQCSNTARLARSRHVSASSSRSSRHTGARSSASTVLSLAVHRYASRSTTIPHVRSMRSTTTSIANYKRLVPHLRILGPALHRSGDWWH